MSEDTIPGRLDVLHSNELPPSIDVVVDFYEHPANEDALQCIRVSVPVMQSARDSEGFIRPGYVGDVTARVLAVLNLGVRESTVTGPLGDLMAAGAHGEVRSGPECNYHAGCQAEVRV